MADFAPVYHRCLPPLLHFFTLAEYHRGCCKSVNGLVKTMDNAIVPASTQRFAKFISAYETLLTRYWIPFGFFVFLTAFFWAPSRHNYKVIMNYALLLPALLAAFTFRRWRSWFFATPIMPLFALYIVYMIGNSAIFGAEAMSFAQWSFYIFLFLFSISSQMYIEERALIRLLTASVAVASLAALYTFVADFRNGTLLHSSYRLFGYGTLYNPLKTGHLIGAFVVVGVWCSFVESRFRPLCWLTTGICALMVLLTGSRAPCLALLAVAILNIFGLCRGRQRHIVLFGFSILSVVITAVFWNKLSERGLSLRPEIWGKAFALTLNHPWFGAGVGTELDIPLSIGESVQDTHNVFLAIFYYGGVAGLALFLLLFGTSFWFAWQRRQSSPLYILAASLQLYGLGTLQFDGGSLIGRPTLFWVLYWLPIALLLYGICRPLREENLDCSSHLTRIHRR